MNGTGEPVEMTRDDLIKLEELLDKHQLLPLLHGLAEVCFEKASYCQRDTAAAKIWSRMGAVIEKQANVLPRAVGMQGMPVPFIGPVFWLRGVESFWHVLWHGDRRRSWPLGRGFPRNVMAEKPDQIVSPTR